MRMLRFDRREGGFFRIELNRIKSKALLVVLVVNLWCGLFVAMVALSSQAGEWLVDSNVGWQMAAQVRSQAYHKLAQPLQWRGLLHDYPLGDGGDGTPLSRLDATVKRLLEDFVGLEMRQPSAITAD